ncbi:MAG TPA: SDR family NAD(P)-dependent oxidoreductase, partial [Kamptonema sp.]|nr:SDR family NAD(P)-dependent oxidoreductase [Kamptonema sp.]
MNTNYSTDPIDKSALAIIGMSGRFPGAKNIDEFWQNLKNGVESTCSFSEEELLSEGIDSVLVNDPHYVKIGSMLSDIGGFDAAFFGFSPREAELTDPQQRIFLECAWEVLENAGYNPEISDFAIGVYAGAGMNVYLLNNVHPNYNSSGRYLIDSALGTQIMIGNYEDYLPTRVSYKLNLKGPSVNVQTACSTSLVAVHIACQNLLNGECDMALAGGISLLLPHKAGYMYQQGMIVSPDGHCRAFDAKAQGTFFGDGVGVLLLKRLEDAIADGDYIHAIIKGSAINNDGNLKVSYTAPSVEGQAEVIAEAHAVAGINAETISYIEAHGTGTAIGDPIEIAALSKAFGASTQKKGFCAIGSVKTNVGHLGAAAGIAGLIKTVLALKYQLIPPSLHFEKPNPQIDFANSPFYVNSQLSEWERNGIPRRAGVSSFGFGGTNAHIILEEAPLQTAKSKNVVAQDPQLKLKSQLLLLSAKTSSALDTATKNLAAHLKENPDINLADVAYTLSIGRKAFNHRLVVVCSSVDEAVSTLTTLEPKRVFINELQDIKKRPVVFMFSGQGSQYVNMGRELYDNEPKFCEQVDLCCELLEPHLGFDLRDVLYPNQEQEQDDYSLQETAITQPALFVIEYALAHLWMEWGIRPAATIGHSIGEYVAATIAGVFSLEDALALVAARGKLMQSMPKGAMLAVSLPEAELQLLLDERSPELSLQVALINSPSNCVVSGTTEAIAVLQNQLANSGVESRLLHTSHAYHSQMMEPILAPFTELVKTVNLQAPKIPYISNLTGTWITAAEATNPSYWAKHLRQTVRFAEGVKQFFAKPEQILLEVGPGRTLSTLAKQHPDRSAEQIILTSLRHPQEKQSDVSCLLNTLGQLWLAGVEVDWLEFYDREQHYRLPLPTYPFERQHYWIAPPKQVNKNGEVQQKKQVSTAIYPSLELNNLVGDNGKDAVKIPQVNLGKNPDIADWFYAPLWTRSPISKPQNKIAVGSCVLVFVDNCGCGSQLVKQLALQGQNVVSVRVSSQFSKLEPRNYTLNPQQRDDYDALLKELIAENLIPKIILHLWSVKPAEQKELGLDWVEASQNLGFYSLLFLAQAIGKQPINDELHIAVVTNNMQNVAAVELLCPEQATVLGPCQIIPIEYPNITCSNIDIVLSEFVTISEQIINQILLEIAAKSSNSIVAYRECDRWIQTFEPVQLNAAEKCRDSAPLASRLKENGVYLITGGLGGIGLTLADYLAKTVQAKLILTTRSTFPSTDEWEQWLATHDEQDPTSCKIRKLQAMQSLGAQIAIACADVANLTQMQAAIALSVEQLGQINGIIHAAGVPGGGVIQRKTREMTERVLAAKVKGTLVLDRIFKDIHIDFFVNCSSLASILPLFGQVDYCAANAFLNAFAHYKTAKDGTFTVSINWDTWQEVGMAVEAVKQPPGEREIQVNEVKKLTNSFFDKCIVEGDREIYVTNLSVSTHWLLNEHIVLGKPTLPGTAYLEMARAAFDAHANGGCIEMRDVYFLNPLVVEGDEEKEVRTILTKQGSNFEFEIVSSSPSGEGWQEHAIGKIACIKEELPEKYEVKKWKKQCKEKVLNPKNNEEIMEFGPRWDSLKELNFGENQGFAYLELPPAFAADLNTYKLHPALLDAATNFMSLKHGGDYLPFSYKRLRIQGTLPAKLYSYIKWEKERQSPQKNLKFNIAIADEQGRGIIEIEDLSIRSIDRAEIASKTPNKYALTIENFSLEIGSPGLLETLTFQPAPRQKPGPGEVEIEVSATGLNFKEVLLALGMLPLQPD